MNRRKLPIFVAIILTIVAVHVLQEWADKITRDYESNWYDFDRGQLSMMFGDWMTGTYSVENFAQKYASCIELIDGSFNTNGVSMNFIFSFTNVHSTTYTTYFVTTNGCIWGRHKEGYLAEVKPSL